MDMEETAVACGENHTLITLQCLRGSILAIKQSSETLYLTQDEKIDLELEFGRFGFLAE